MPGIRMSISTTSGRRSRASAHRLVAVGGLADHLDVGLGVEQRPEPGPHQRLVVGEHDADHGPPVSGTGPAPEAATRPRRLPRMPPSADARSRMP